MLSNVSQWCDHRNKNEKEGKLPKKRLVCLNISNNKIQELEGALFMHLGIEVCNQIEIIRADHNQIRYISNRIKDCHNLRILKLSYNELWNPHHIFPVDMLCSPQIRQSLQILHLSNNKIRELPLQLNNFKSLKVLNLENNKIRSLLLRVSEGSNLDHACPIGGLENIEELYLNNNRLKDLPTVF